MLGLKPALDLAQPEYLTHVHRLGKPFETVLPEIAVVEKAARQVACAR